MKTTKFGNPVYLGDPINVLRIFNEKEADEMVLLDIAATRERRGPDVPFLERVVAECFMPVCYGGGIASLDHARALFSAGVEKISVNTHASAEMNFVREAADRFGSQSVVVSMDVRRKWGRSSVWVASQRRKLDVPPEAFAERAQAAGAGELLLQSVDRDGTMGGYDLELVRRVTAAVDIPVVACGGAGSAAHLVEVINSAGAAAAGAGSLFVFHGRHRAVLINMPSEAELRSAFAEGK